MNDLRRVFATADDDAWASSFSADLLHWDGISWKTISAPTSDPIVAFWGSSRSDLWAAAGDSVLFHFDGENWTTLTPPCPPSTKLVELWGTRRDDVWAFGEAEAALALHWDGVAWTQISLSLSPFGGRFLVCGRDSLEFAYLGATSDFYSWDGSQFELQPDEPIFYDSEPRGCVFDENGDLWLFRSDGSVLQRSHRWR